MEEILKLENKEQAKFLRKKTQKFDFGRYAPEEVRSLVSRMRRTMEKANGIGLAANQIGLNERVFVAKWDDKFYAVFNPELSNPSKEKEEIEEGCLSIPEKYGVVKRPAAVILTGENSSGKKIKIKAWDMLARIFQHEVDHLDGKLYVDRMSKFQKLESREPEE